MYQMMLNRKNSRKGFTLVEVIVVLVILAILAAIMIPAMTGWIDEANKKKVVVEARTVMLACQTAASEIYGETGATASDADMKARANTILGSDGSTANATVTLTGNLITKFVYTKDTHTATYAGNKWTVE